MLTQQDVYRALQKIADPQRGHDIVSLGMVKAVELDGTKVAITIQLSSNQSPLKNTLERQIAEVLQHTEATEFALELSVPTPAPSTPAPGQAPSGPAPTGLPQIKSIIAVGAGKGGVGKSTIAVNLAVALARTGRSVGLMDGDIYGPSAPTMLGLKGKAPSVSGGKILPFETHGIHVITIGALVDAEKPLIWRGPMAHGAFKQLMLDNTLWPELDILIVDLPPGTGDVPLTLCQLFPLTGAVIVATPQQVALDDATRAVRMFQQLNTQILGFVENMSYLPQADGTRLDLFGTGGAEREAARLRLPFLGALPLYPELRINSDAGNPTANFDGPNRDLAASLELLASNLLAQVELRNAFPAAPSLTMT
jgi:ATP-binding protein involved in chromosome partitioning